jgi:hypothetical protein
LLPALPLTLLLPLLTQALLVAILFCKANHYRRSFDGMNNMHLKLKVAQVAFVVIVITFLILAYILLRWLLYWMEGGAGIAVQISAHLLVGFLYGLVVSTLMNSSAAIIKTVSGWQRRPHA